VRSHRTPANCLPARRKRSRPKPAADPLLDVWLEIAAPLSPTWPLPLRGSRVAIGQRKWTASLSLPGASYGTTRRRGGFTAVATREKSVRFPARPPTSIRESTELRRVHPSRQLTVAVAPVGDVAALQGYICSSRNTSRLRKVGGPSQSAASCAANSLVSGRSEFAIASS
jgi:hypothetical protein